MKTDNIIVDKSKAFAVRTVKLYQHLCNEKKSLCCQSNYCEAEQV